MQHDSVNQWIDAGELRLTAESLMNPVAPKAKTGSDDVYGKQFVGYADSTFSQERHASMRQQMESPFRRSLEAQAEFQQLTKPLGEQEEVLSEPISGVNKEFQGMTQSVPPIRQPLAHRMQAFGNWLKQSVSVEAFFVCDRNGEIICDEVKNEKFVKVARTLGHAASITGLQFGDAGGPTNSFVKISPNRFLQVIPKRSKFGLVILGVVLPAALDVKTTGVIAQSLNKTLGD